MRPTTATAAASSSDGQPLDQREQCSRFGRGTGSLFSLALSINIPDHLASPCAAFRLPLFYPRVHKTRREVGSGRGGAGKEMAGSGEAKSSAEEACGEKKYGGMEPKKPLISKDHERAYFDSADWVLGKQAANSNTRAAVESLKPKLKRTPHPQLPPRKPTCASS